MLLFRMMRQVALVLFTLGVSTVFSITPEECEDGEFHLDPDNCPYSYFRCYVKPNVRICINESNGFGFNKYIKDTLAIGRDIIPSLAYTRFYV